MRFTRTLDTSGYARIRLWKVYCEEGLARCEVALWLGTESLTVAYRGETLSRYEVEYISSSGALREVTKPILFETSHAALQMRLCDLVEALGEDGWLKALKVSEYALHKPRRTRASQRRLFPLAEAL